MWQLIRELVAGGVTVLLTTQYLDEADQLADRIAVLDHGRMVAQGTPEQLKRLVPGGHIRLRFTAPEEFALAGQVLPSASRDEEALVLQVPSDGSVHTLRALLARIDDALPRGGRTDRPHPRPGRRVLRRHRSAHHAEKRESDEQMSTSYPMADTATMLRRNLRHAQRYPAVARRPRDAGDHDAAVRPRLRRHLSAGLGGGDGFDYIDFLTPGILLMSIASGRCPPRSAPPWT